MLIPSLLFALMPSSFARPTDGTGAWSFDATDDVRTVDSPNGLVRVWYSVSGPNQVLMDDADGSGVPDFAELVGTTAEDVLARYADEGFRPPLSDGTGGGSAAMDAYLVDFGGDADGLFSAESCTGGSPRQCSGYFVMENDFAGYGYSDVPGAIRILTSHELFHAVQAAYDADEEVWWSEGSAVWAEWLYDPGTEDFLWFADAYLDDVSRSLDEPPSGPVPTFAYATGLWWYFLANRYGDDVMVELLESTEGSDDLLASMEAIEEARGGSVWDDWSTFVEWNLATGSQAGAADSYEFASRIGPPEAEDRGQQIVDDNRYYPLAATYYQLNWGGGPLSFALEADAPELYFSLHGTDANGDITPAIQTWQGQAAVLDLGDQPEGTYWLVGAKAEIAENSTKVVTCLGDADAVAECAASGETGDTGGDTAGTDDTAGDTGGADDTAGDTGEEKGGCGCAGAGSDVLIAPLLAGLALVATRRRA